MSTVATLCGSLGEHSANASLLTSFTRAIVHCGATVEHFSELRDIPGLRPGPPPQSVIALRTLVERTDAMVVAAPEYAGGVAGVAKNALDWLVESGSAYGKACVVLCAGTTGGTFARAQLIRTLSWQGAHVVASFGVSAPKTRRDENGAWDESVRASLTATATRLREALCDQAARRSLCTEVLRPHGIDVERFGWTS